MEDKTMTKAEVKEFLNCGRDTVDRIFASPSFPKFYIGKKKAVVLEKDFLAWIEMLKKNRKEQEDGN